MGYLVGGLNPAFILGEIKGFDIRRKGSGNAGASNATIIMGKAVGIFCALFDIFKAYFAVKISIRLYPVYKIVGILAGVFCILGHMFPVAMGFHGGKGLASLGGVILAYNVKVFLVLILVEAVIVLSTDYICIAAPSVSQIFTVILLIESGPIYSLIFIPAAAAVLFRHRDNFRRMKYGVEARLSFLWNKEEEEKRISDNWGKLSAKERASINMPSFSIESDNL